MVVTAGARRDPSGAVADLLWDDRSSTRISFKAGGEDVLEDYFLQFPLGPRLYTRPTPYFCRLENAVVSPHPVWIEVQRAPRRALVWLDGRFARNLSGRAT